MKIFEDLTVVELSSVLAGPMVGTFFSEMGAKVIKVENSTTGGDVTRQWKLPKEDKAGRFSAYYASANFSKQSMLLNLKDKDCLKVVYSLCKTADVVICNFKAGVSEKLGVDYATLKSLNKRLIYAELSGFGAESKRPAFDVVLQAESGFMYMNGEPGGKPVKMPVALIDILAAHQLKEGILTALYKREKTKEGSLVQASLFDSAVASLANQASNWLMTQHIPQKMGSLHPNIAPYGEQFTTKDKKNIVLAVGNNKQFFNLCEVLNLPEVYSDSKYQTNTNRVENRADLESILQAEIYKFGAAELLINLENKEVPAGLVRNMQEVFSLEKAKEMVREEYLADGTLATSVKTISFKIS